MRTCGPSAKVLARNPNTPCGSSPRLSADIWAIGKGSAPPQREQKYSGTAWPEQHVRTCGASAKVLRNPSANENIYAGLALEHHLRPLGPSARSRRNPNANENNLVQRSANEHVLAQRAPSNICGHVGHQQRFSRETQTRHVGPALGFLRTYGPSVKVLCHPNANKSIRYSVARATCADMWAISKGSAQPKRE